MKKILHITNWYPYGDDQNGDFIQRHYHCAKKISHSELLHIQVISGKIKFKSNLYTQSEEKYLLLSIPFNSSRILEIFTTMLLVYALVSFKFQKKSYDLYVFHIAYPLLSYTRLIKRILLKPIVILEHWSAYSQNFYLPKGSKGRQRIANIFYHNIPIITVSEVLRDDIVRFSEIDAFDKYIIPNVIFDRVFFPQKVVKKENIVFFMLAGWSFKEKRLMLGVEAFYEACKYFINIQLRIGGKGTQLDEAKQFLKKYPDVSKKVTFLGQIEYEEVGNEMRNANAFLHPSNIETFSLVCAEALFCNTPVIASNLPTIANFVNESNGKLIENTSESWNKAVKDFLLYSNEFVNKDIGIDVRVRFSPHAIAIKMDNTFSTIIENWCKNDK
jgi:glycosyltransferase involved in cell wall biosynthesis